MSKSDGWDKQSNGWEWRKSSDVYRAEIAKVTGNGSTPFTWRVYPLPRSLHLDERGRYRAVGAGSDRTLAEAKRRADIAIAAFVSVRA